MISNKSSTVTYIENHLRYFIKRNNIKTLVAVLKKFTKPDITNCNIAEVIFIVIDAKYA